MMADPDCGQVRRASRRCLAKPSPVRVLAGRRRMGKGDRFAAAASNGRVDCLSCRPFRRPPNISPRKGSPLTGSTDCNRFQLAIFSSVQESAHLCRPYSRRAACNQLAGRRVGDDNCKSRFLVPRRGVSFCLPTACDSGRAMGLAYQRTQPSAREQRVELSTSAQDANIRCHENVPHAIGRQTLGGVSELARFESEADSRRRRRRCCGEHQPRQPGSDGCHAEV